MKTYMIVIFFLGIVLVWGCGQEEVKKDETLQEKTEAPKTPGAPGSVDLSGHGVNLVVDIPDGMKDKLVFDNTMDLRIEVGGEYAILIAGHEIEPEDEVMKDIVSERMKERKEEIKTNPSVAFGKFLADEPMLVMWETGGDSKEFQCYGIVVSGNTWYEIETALMQNETCYSEAAQKKIMQIIKSAKLSVK